MGYWIKSSMCKGGSNYIRGIEDPKGRPKKRKVNLKDNLEVNLYRVTDFRKQEVGVFNTEELEAFLCMRFVSIRQGYINKPGKRAKGLYYVTTVKE